MFAHVPSSTAASLGVLATAASIAAPDWRIVLANGLVTIAGAAVSAYLRHTHNKARRAEFQTRIKAGVTTGKPSRGKRRRNPRGNPAADQTNKSPENGAN